MPTFDYSLHSPFNEREGEYIQNGPTSETIAVGDETLSRRSLISSAVSTATQSLRLTYFTATKTETITQVLTHTGGTAAAATPTLCRIGVYLEEANGDLTLVASTANDTTLFAAASTVYTKALQAPFEKLIGKRYAVGILIVTAVATPTFYGSATIPLTFNFIVPTLAALKNSQADLPSSIVKGTMTGGFTYYVQLLP